MLISRANRLFSAQSVDDAGTPLGTVGVPYWQRPLMRFRLGRRLLRAMFYNVVPLADDAYFVTFARSAGVIREGRFAPLKGMHRPCRVLRGACAHQPDGTVWFGEYLPNTERGEMRVYRLAAGETRVETALSFAPGEIRHVHGVYADPYESTSLWCLTGDALSECRMLRSENGFRSFEIVGAGDETWRAVSVQFTRDAIYYGSDAEYRQNFIYRIDRRTGARTPICAVGGPVYYSACVGGDLFFAVTAEGAPAQPCNEAELWCLSSGAGQRIAVFEKDMFPIQFLPGTLNFSLGTGRDGVFVHCLGLKGVDGQTFRLVRDSSPISD